MKMILNLNDLFRIVFLYVNVFPYENFKYPHFSSGRENEHVTGEEYVHVTIFMRNVVLVVNC